MATFTYKCNKCGEQFEATQSIFDDALTECTVDQCDGTVRRIVVPGTSFRIGGMGVSNPTSMFNMSNDHGR